MYVSRQLGDAVSGDKIMHHAAGDQININRARGKQAGAERGGDQASINQTAVTPAVGKCAQCGQPVQADDQICQSCGVPL